MTAPARRPDERGAEILALDDNTNLFGMPPAAVRGFEGAAGLLPRYPEEGAVTLRVALAAYAGVEAEAVVVGCGSDDLLAASFHALAEPGERLAYAAPTFSMVPPFARAARLEAAAVPFAAGGALDADALLATGATLTYVCAPNNPTGTMPEEEAVARLLAGARGIVIRDEAYAEFAAGGLAAPAERRENLVVLRTLSKAFGLAGLRVGYAIAPPPIARKVRDVLGPYRVGTLAERAAVAALRGDLPWVRARTAEACAVRDRLAEALRELGFAPLPSAANFLLVPVAGAAATAAALERHGVRVRAFPALEGIGDALRVTVAPWPLLERLLAALAAVRP